MKQLHTVNLGYSRIGALEDCRTKTERQQDLMPQTNDQINDTHFHTRKETFVEHCIVDLDDYDTDGIEDTKHKNKFRTPCNRVDIAISKFELHCGIPKYVYIDLTKANDFESLDDCSYERRQSRRFSSQNDTIFDAYSDYNIWLYGNKEMTAVLKGTLEKHLSVENPNPRDETTCTTVESTLIAI